MVESYIHGNTARVLESTPYLKPRPTLTRAPIPVKDMWVNSAQRLNRRNITSGVFNSIHINFPPEYSSITNELTENLTHQSGISGAKVRDAETFSQKNVDGSYTIRGQKYVIKNNFNSGCSVDTVLNQYECDLLNAHADEGLPFVRAQIGTNRSLFIQHAGYTTLRDYIETSTMTMGTTLEFVTQLAEDLMKVMPQMELTTSSRLGTDGKEYLSQKYIARLAETFGVDPEIAKQNYFALQLLRHMPGATAENLPLYLPFARAVEEAVHKYGTWGTEIHPGNIAVIDTNSTLPRNSTLNHRLITSHLGYTIFDFNRPQFGFMQQFDSSFLDASTPLMELAYRVATYNSSGVSVPITKIFDPKKCYSLLETRIAATQKLTGERIDVDEYIRFYDVGSAFNSLMLAQHSLERIAVAKDFQTIVLSHADYYHYLAEFGAGLHDMVKTFLSYDEISDWIAHIDKSLSMAYQSVMTNKLNSKLDDWYHYESVPLDNDCV